MLLLYVGAGPQISWGAGDRKSLDSKWEGNQIFNHWKCGYFWFNIKTVKPKHGGAAFMVLQVIREATKEEILQEDLKDFAKLAESLGYIFSEFIFGKRYIGEYVFKHGLAIYVNPDGREWVYEYDYERETDDYSKLRFDIAICDPSESGKYQIEAEESAKIILANEKSYSRIIQGRYNRPGKRGHQSITIGVSYVNVPKC